jgi:hypothetical protein
MNEYRARIVAVPSVHFGKPCVAGTRIPVEAVLELIQEGASFGEIIEKYYPDLVKSPGSVLKRQMPNPSQSVSPAPFAI